ncbi:aminotransferase class I/II-fold pyridoxal phosphate-dependent enzyme [Paenibacillus albiflavus]|uniref:aminotransferase class I/II-fold pyridoxal phosphate-dependent enzyme n=1 Tax=Paenibacillus albiflavus TaxID=2545760 RepID=UPI001F46E00C|nr:aminotransferase class I/II-fold pyridoxal phosphate-dependent enzyme [Paenibacillus albiflavus]
MRDRAPLFAKLTEHHRSKALSFHVPGHKFGRGLKQEEEVYTYYHHIMSIDGTEIAGFDDLHHPEGVIQEAQELAAECFGAEQTWFLVGGSTAGNLAMIQALCDRDDILIVQRNVHKSVIHGLMLAGARAVFISPKVDQESGIAAGVRPQDVEEALKKYPDAKGVLLTNPNYYGMGIDLERIAAIAHQYDKPLLVDEAHGAHYGFHVRLPQSALACGADLVVQSTHKMLSAMTMSAMLHVQGNRIDRGAVHKYLAMLQSSSPSYPLMASLDLARYELDTDGHRLIEQGLAVVEHFHSLMEHLPEYRILIHQEQQSAYTSLDPFKVTIMDSTGTLSGPRLAHELEVRGCYPELSDAKHVLLLFTLHSTRGDAERVYEMLIEISNYYQLAKQETSSAISNINELPPFLPLSDPISLDTRLYRQVSQTQMPLVRSLAIMDAIGECSAEMVIPYPPGIPILYPGEQITAYTADLMMKLIANGIKFQGSDIGAHSIINVFTGGN